MSGHILIFGARKQWDSSVCVVIWKYIDPLARDMTGNFHRKIKAEEKCFFQHNPMTMKSPMQSNSEKKDFVYGHAKIIIA